MPIRAPRNRTITPTDAEWTAARQRVKSVPEMQSGEHDVTVHGDCLDAAHCITAGSVDLLFLDPPYNLNKTFGGKGFVRQSVESYGKWFGQVLDTLLPLVKPNGTVYICGDWHTSASIFSVADARLHVRSRITWEREKGRGASKNWKNASEDIWFCTVGKEYTFNVDAVKLRRKVIAPYRDKNGAPKDWEETKDGAFRDTHPSNIWNDITIPFWSMPENTDHPTQKSEKLLAKLLLASTNEGDLVLDPFLGSGTTSVVARKLNRHFIGIEAHEEYALLAAHRLDLALSDKNIQGYADGVFWERNSMNAQSKAAPRQINQEILLV